MKVYLSGPMSGYENWNGPAFEKYAAQLRAKGLEVVSPWEMDKDVHDQPYRTYLARDCFTILYPSYGIEAVYMMPGWEKSKGAQLERHCAEAIGLPVVLLYDENIDGAL